MVFLDNHPKNSETFVCLALNGSLYGYNKKTNKRTALFATLAEAWAAIDSKDTKWMPMPK